MPAISTTQLYKYRLKELSIQIYGCACTEAKNDLIEKGITKRTISRDFNQLKGSPGKIPASRLTVYAEWLKVGIETLKA